MRAGSPETHVTGSAMDYEWVGDWLTHEDRKSSDGKYFHKLFKPEAGATPETLAKLRSYVVQAHQDARSTFLEFFGISLDSGSPPAAEDTYPWELPHRIKQGCFGECLAALLIESSEPFGDGQFKVPAHLFRFHGLGYDWLLAKRQGVAPSGLVGRTGTDIAAYKFDDAVGVTSTLVIESKCLSRHDNGLLGKAHKQVSSPLAFPVSTWQVKTILEDRGDPESMKLAGYLGVLMLNQGSGAPRNDAISYAVPQSPPDQTSWSDPAKAHTDYTGGRRLLVIEVQLPDLAILIANSYAKPQVAKQAGIVP